jgi:hypothetical protein
MNQPIGANLNEAHNMLTPSVYDNYNKKVINKIEHKPQSRPTFFQRVWSWITYPLSCCWNTDDTNETEVYHDLKYDNTQLPNQPKFVDTGLNKIPVDVFEERLKALQAELDRQDKEFLRDVSREEAQKRFDEFNKVRNDEVNVQFKQMQREKGY